MGFLEQEYFDNTVRQYLYAAGVAVATVVAVRLVRTVVQRRMRKLAAQTETGLDDLFFELVASTRPLVVVVLAVCAGAGMLEVPRLAARLLPVLATTMLLIQVGLWGTAAVRFLVDRRRRGREGEPDTRAAFGVLGVLGMGAVWVIVILLLLDNFGVDVTALVTGLGIGGVAVALAVQKILSDLFASVSIVLDKPFQVGDFIIVDTFMGTVEHVGLKTTRVRSLSGERIVFSNSDLVNARLRNFKEQQERRVEFRFGLLYETPAEQVAAVPGLVREVIEAQPNTRFDRAHFKEYGDSALVFEAVYVVTSPDYNLYMDTQQAINLGLMQRFQARGIGFALPTRTVYMHTVEQPGRAAEEPGRAGDGRAAKRATTAA
jgi:small-conductance mechanosensitive channel